MNDLLCNLAIIDKDQSQRSLKLSHVRHCSNISKNRAGSLRPGSHCRQDGHANAPLARRLRLRPVTRQLIHAQGLLCADASAILAPDYATLSYPGLEQIVDRAGHARALLGLDRTSRVGLVYRAPEYALQSSWDEFIRAGAAELATVVAGRSA